MNPLRSLRCITALAALFVPAKALPAAAPSTAWTVGTPIVTYWCGPAMTDAVATQMAEGGWNVVWCGEKDLDVAQRHGLRAQLQEGLLSPAAIDDPKQREKLDALIERVRRHPALYCYFITDEPSAGQFAALGRLVAHLRERDPAHLAYINLFPTYANNEQLGTKGDTVTAYKEHLRQYIDVVKPSLISYDHYQFAADGDRSEYFLNLALIRDAALAARLPFLNIVQACSWTPSMRVPNGDEMRYLLYTTLAYGGEGISYYIYTCAGHKGGIANADGTPTPLYDALKTLNREFVAIARELQPLHSISAYHAGMLPKGAAGVPANAAFKVEPALPATTQASHQPVTGVLFGCFGADTNATPTHAVVVNLDYRTDRKTTVRAPGPVQAFDAAAGKWSESHQTPIDLQLPRGGGTLLRVGR